MTLPEQHSPLAAQMDTAWPTTTLELHNQNIPFAEPIFGGYLGSVLLNASSETPIVELGAGIGYLGKTIPPSFRHRYIQTEIGEENCAQARKCSPDLVTLAAKAQELPFRTGSVGAVVARNLFDMVDTPAVIAEISRVLHPGGLAIHLRDHRPSLVWIGQHCALNNKQYVPHYDAAGNFQRYNVVSPKDLSQFLAEKPMITHAELTDPHALELTSVGQFGTVQREKLKLFSKLVGAKAERQTPLFTTMMDKKLASWFKQADFSTAFDNFPGTYDMPLDYALRRGWQAGANYFEQSRQPRYGHDASVPSTMVRVTHSFDVIAAVKKCS